MVRHHTEEEVVVVQLQAQVRCQVDLREHMGVQAVAALVLMI